MAKRFSLEFKQQAIDYALANAYEPLARIAVKLGVNRTGFVGDSLLKLSHLA